MRKGETKMPKYSKKQRKQKRSKYHRTAYLWGNTPSKMGNIKYHPFRHGIIEQRKTYKTKYRGY